MEGKNKIVIGFIILFIGIILILYPQITKEVYEKKTKKNKTIFVEERSKKNSQMEQLYNVLYLQNKKLYKEKQEELIDEDSYKRVKINLKKYGIPDNTIGYLFIPRMKVTLPILLGATEKNMKKGAVHLTETSYPIGGKNTNCVIAAHRGYSKATMFREIEKLKYGDKIYLENIKEKLIYKVINIKIINPADIEEIMIQDGKDMITLMTCHPYRKNSKRYMVFCERI